VRESKPDEEVSHLTQPFVPYSVACPRSAFLGVNRMNVDFDD